MATRCVASALRFPWFVAAAVVLAGCGSQPIRTDPPHDKEVKNVSIYVGSEKSAFLANPRVIEILSERYKLRVHAEKAGGVEMALGLPLAGKDAIWPSSDTAADFFKQERGVPLAQRTVFSTPIVYFSWAPIAEALVRAQLATVREGVYYVSDNAGLIRAVTERRTWKDLGIDNVFGTVKIYATDPKRSNSGMLFAGLVASMFNDERLLVAEDVGRVLPLVNNFFTQLGSLEGASSDLFESFLQMGMGGRPIIVGYENQILEVFAGRPQMRDAVREDIRVLYPSPTVWSAHPLLALTLPGRELVEAMGDKDLLTIAWKEHGFRTPFQSLGLDMEAAQPFGIATTIDTSMPVPEAAVMTTLLQGL